MSTLDVTRSDLFDSMPWVAEPGQERRVNEASDAAGGGGAGGNKLPKKPKYGAACNGCGLCCALELCNAADIVFPGASAPCPALKLSPDGTRTYCQLVMIEKAAGMEPMLEKALGIGLGCSMEDGEAVGGQLDAPETEPRGSATNGAERQSRAPKTP